MANDLSRDVSKLRFDTANASVHATISSWLILGHQIRAPRPHAPRFHCTGMRLRNSTPTTPSVILPKSHAICDRSVDSSSCSNARGTAGQTCAMKPCEASPRIENRGYVVGKINRQVFSSVGVGMHLSKAGGAEGGSAAASHRFADLASHFGSAGIFPVARLADLGRSFVWRALLPRCPDLRSRAAGPQPQIWRAPRVACLSAVLHGESAVVVAAARLTALVFPELQQPTAFQASPSGSKSVSGYGGGLNRSTQHLGRTRLALKTMVKSLARVRSAGTLPWLGFDQVQPNRSLLPGKHCRINALDGVASTG